MFCQKCGNTVEENAVFCPRCGARQPVEIKMEQTVEGIAESTEQKIEKPALPIHSRKKLKKVYEQMRENFALCPEIKSVVLKDSSSEVVAAGRYNKYVILVSDNPISLGSSPGIPLAIPVILCLVLYCVCFLTCFSDTPVFWGVWGLGILSNLYGYYISAAINKERKTVMSFIKTVLGQQKYIEPSGRLEIMICSMYMFLGVMCLVVKVIFLIVT